ncbi:hypothetical protein HID58_041295 [Brassica napus]|uniref:(rape) hypothetical protein n=1 Tax=Brassica napus TaxID=3708 RepID=A0A816R4V0_BRANA|nr:hypothetical protein HID58_041295 [Brassica napus]CAF2070253.1 unnamed protein product [Brassica napus]
MVSFLFSCYLECKTQKQLTCSSSVLKSFNYSVFCGNRMSLSTILMTSFGALDVWTDYVTGKDMGFKLPC